MDPNDSVDNCRRAMELARDRFNIPMVLEPEYLASPYLDELSGMTYLSYFMKEKSPGTKATLNWVNSQLKNRTVTNFTVSTIYVYYAYSVHYARDIYIYIHRTFLSKTINVVIWREIAFVTFSLTSFLDRLERRYSLVRTDEIPRRTGQVSDIRRSGNLGVQLKCG